MNASPNIIKEMNYDESFWKHIRSLFNLSPDYVHFEAFLLSSHPEPVREAIEQYRKHLDADPYIYLSRNEQQLESDSRKSVADFIGGAKDEIILTENATTGLSLVYNGLALNPGDEILTTRHEHHSNRRALDNLVKRTGAILKIVEIYTDGEDINPDEMVCRLAAEFSHKTRLIALTWVHSCSGVCIPVSSLVNAVRRHFSTIDSNPLVCIDGTHGCGARQLNVINMGCDIFVSGCHKWLHGPRGTGFIWANKRAMDTLSVIIPSFAPGEVDVFRRVESPRFVDAGEHLSPGGFHCFEHRWAIHAAICFIEHIGIQVIQERIQSLALRLKLGLSKIEGVKVVTPIDIKYSAGIVCFSIDGLSPQFVSKELCEQKIICIVSPYQMQYCRFSTSIYNLVSDIDMAIQGVEFVANLKRQVKNANSILKNQ